MDYQKSFFDFLKSNIPEEVTLPEYIEEKLHVSRDGAYRRIGGRTALTINEAMTLLHGRNLNMLDFAGRLPGQLIFEQITKGASNSPAAYASYFDFLSKIGAKEYIAMTSAIPRAYLIDFQDLAFFHLFYTAKTIAGDPGMQGATFSLDHPLRSPFLEVISPVCDILYNIPSIEIIWMDALQVVLKPILYYLDTNQMDSPKTALAILDELMELINYLEKMAMAGRKFRLGETYGNFSPAVQFYFTEIPLQDSTAIFFLQNDLLVLHILNGFSTISTTNPHYCRDVQALTQSILEKSTNLTTSGEKVRLQIFNAHRKEVEEAIKKVKSSYK